MPFSLSSAWRRTSSWKFVLPPSMIVSPGSRCSSSSCDLGLGGVAGRDHDPDGARLLQRGDQSAIENDAVAPSPAISLRLLRRPVVDDDLVPVADQPADHVGPHPAEADEPDAHGWSGLRAWFEGGRQRTLERGQAGVRVGAEVDPDDRQVVRFDRREVARRLGVDELAERVRPARDVQVGRVIRGQLEEPADRGAALVQLAGRVEEARAVAGGRRAAGPVTEQRADPGERVVASGGRGDERLEAQVGVRPAPREVARQLADDAVVARGQPERRVAVQGQPVAARDRRRG